MLNFDFANARAGDGHSAQRPLLLDWEFLSSDGWQPLTLVEDGTERFTRDGKVTLAKFFGPDSKIDSVGGHTSCWIRGTVSSRTPHARIAIEPAGYLVRFAAGARHPPSPSATRCTRSARRRNSEVVWRSARGRLILASALAGAARRPPLRRGAHDPGHRD